MGGGKGGGSQTVQQKSDPWKGIQPYLIGSSTRKLKAGVTPIYGNSGGGLSFEEWKQNNPGGSFFDWEQQNQNGGSQVLMNPDSDYETSSTPGLYPEASSLYQGSKWSPQMDALNQKNINRMAIAADNPHYSNIWEAGDNAVRGQYDAQLNKIGTIGADQVDPRYAFYSMGAANPTNSIAQMLSGRVNTSTLNPVVNTALGRLADNFSEGVMPQIRSGAVGAGQYGSSRQGIAEGLASKGLAQSMGDTVANMYNQAYNQAQQQMYGTANNMAGLSLNNAQTNANRNLSADQTNAQIQYNNNAQALQGSQQKLANLTSGANLVNLGFGGQQNLYNTVQDLYNRPNAYNWNQLQNYSNILSPGLGVQGNKSTTQSQDNGLLSDLGTLGNTAMTFAKLWAMV